jgi:hypothetical protein
MSEISHYEMVVDNFVEMYTNYVDTWASGVSYFRADTSPDVIKIVTQYLSITFRELFKNKFILDWRSVEEWPESMENKIVYSIVNLLIQQNSTFLPDDIRTFILEQPIPKDDPEYRKKLLTSLYAKVYTNTGKLNDIISRETQSIKDIVNQYHLNDSFTTLYNTNTKIYLFSGVKEVVFNNEQLYDFIKSGGTPNHYFPLRSWTVELRVAMQFTSSDDKTARNYSEISDKPFRLILITERDDICYVSPYENSWEAEALISSGNYFCGGYFFKDIRFFGPPYNKPVEYKRFLFVIISKIDTIPQRVMNKIQFERLINSVYTRFLKDETRIDYGVEFDEDDSVEYSTPPPSFKRFRASSKYRKKAKKQKKKRARPKSRRRNKGRTRRISKRRDKRISKRRNKGRTKRRNKRRTRTKSHSDTTQ